MKKNERTGVFGGGLSSEEVSMARVRLNVLTLNQNVGEE